jgi:hypothetical protein
MDISNTTSFDWLRNECLQIQSKKFHIFAKAAGDGALIVSDPVSAKIGCDYDKFLLEFGYARFFTDHNDSPQLSVYPLDGLRVIRNDSGKEFVGFGFRSSNSYYFDKHAITQDGISTVFMHKGKHIEHSNNSFSEWLVHSYEAVKGKYTDKKWKQIIAGPRPFSDEEKLVVEARARYRWALTGFKSDGTAIFRVENLSSMQLPFLSVGVRDREKCILEGGVWLNVGHIEPGKFADVEADCYKDQIPSDLLVVFDLPEPIPEKRAAYWEFGIPK